jgi:WD40 repeat protein
MTWRWLGLGGLVWLGLAPLQGEVVFSRRVYRERGASYQQIWSWNPADESLQQLTDSPRNHFQPVCAGRRIVFVSPEAKESARLWSFDRDTHTERVIGPVPHEGQESNGPVPGCQVSAVANPLEACGNGSDVSVSRGGKQIGRFHISADTLPIRLLAWSPSGRWLLVGTIGADTNSTSPQSDFYLLEIEKMKLTASGSGNDEAWIPGRDDFIYTAPRELASLTGARRPRSVWVQHLMVYSAASGQVTAITSGITNNRQPSVCGK